MAHPDTPHQEKVIRQIRCLGLLALAQKMVEGKQQVLIDVYSNGKKQPSCLSWLKLEGTSAEGVSLNLGAKKR